jgi:hypothetical protein
LLIDWTVAEVRFVQGVDVIVAAYTPSRWSSPRLGQPPPIVELLRGEDAADARQAALDAVDVS